MREWWEQSTNVCILYNKELLREKKKRDDRNELKKTKKECATNGEKKNNKYFYELLKCMHLPFLSNNIYISYIFISLYATTTEDDVKVELKRRKSDANMKVYV